MDKLQTIASCLFALALTGMLIALARSFWKKANVVTVVEFQCSSGDSEALVFKTQFLEKESDESKAAKLSDAFTAVETRREENHLKWLKKKAAAQAKNEKLSPGELKMANLAERREKELAGVDPDAVDPSEGNTA